jgi:hypothetical protein
MTDWDEGEGKLMKDGYALYLKSASQITIIYVTASYCNIRQEEDIEGKV